MASSRRRFAIWACVFGAATLVVGIGVATGAKKLKTKSASETLSAGEFDDVTAKCKKGTKAVSGGFASENDPAGSGEAILPYMSRAEGGRKWTSAGVGISAVSGDLTSFAYCRDQKIKRRSEEETLSGGETDAVTATCPQGTKVASGGFDNPDFVLNGTDIVIFPTESLKTGKREWTVSATNLTGNPGELIGQVNCQEGKGLRTFDETLSITSPGVHDVEAECGGGRRVVSGGFEYSLPPSEGAYVSASHKVGKREWEVEAVDFDAPATLTAYAYCEKKKKKK